MLAKERNQLMKTTTVCYSKPSFTIRSKTLIWFCKIKLLKIYNKIKKSSASGNWTRVSRVTGGDTNHYTNADLLKLTFTFCNFNYIDLFTLYFQLTVMFGSSLFIFMIIDFNFRLCFLKNSEDFIFLMFVIFEWI